MCRAWSFGSPGRRGLCHERSDNLFGRHLEPVALIAVVVNAVHPDVVVEDLAVLHPKLVVEVRRLVPGSAMGRIISPCLEGLAGLKADDPDLVAVSSEIRLVRDEPGSSARDLGHMSRELGLPLAVCALPPGRPEDSENHTGLPTPSLGAARGTDTPWRRRSINCHDL